MKCFLLLLTLICVCAFSVCTQTISAPNPILDADEHAVYYEVAEGDASSETLPAIERKTIPASCSIRRVRKTIRYMCARIILRQKRHPKASIC